MKFTKPIAEELLILKTKLSDIDDFNQCIVNEYLYNQGISSHIDSLKFGPKIVSLSLLDDTIMDFTLNNVVEKVYIPKRSLLILENNARYLWKHSISNKLELNCENHIIKKDKHYRRVSITMRKAL